MKTMTKAVTVAVLIGTACGAAVIPHPSAAAPDVSVWADALRADAYGVLPPGRVTGGVVIPFGGDVAWAPFGLTVEAKCGTVEVDGSVVLDLSDATTNSVTCSSGWFACCRCNNGCAVARCRRNAQDDGDCQGGGHGATSCTITCK